MSAADYQWLSDSILFYLIIFILIYLFLLTEKYRLTESDISY